MFCRASDSAADVGFRRLRALLVAAGILAGACGGAPNSPGPLPGSGSPLPAPGAPQGGDVTTPYPIDRGDDGPGTPGTYKGLWLRLVTRPAPAIAPVDGLVGVVCVGMSNGAQECGQWIQQVAGPWRGEVSPAVRIVNCAVGGHAIERWSDPAFDAVLWDDCTQRRLALAGLRIDQVRVLYHKAANQFRGGGGAAEFYPAPTANFFRFRSNLQSFSARVRGKFPAVQAVFTTSRSYGGFAGTGQLGEPSSYEEGHALNAWLETTSEVDGIWFGWGPYIWAPACSSGVTNGSGVCYAREDYRDDAIHPTAAGELKIARMIHERFRREAWYRP